MRSALLFLLGLAAFAKAQEAQNENQQRLFRMMHQGLFDNDEDKVQEEGDFFFFFLGSSVDLKYRLRVIRGSGDGRYLAGTEVNVRARSCPKGQEVKTWEVLEGNPTVVDINSPDTVLTMPAEDVTIRAVCGPKIFRLIVERGSGDGDYPAAEEVSVEADECPEGEVFKKWRVLAGRPIIDDETDPETKITMPAGDVIIKAVCEEVFYKLIVRKGSGDGDYPGGEEVPVKADVCPRNQEFVRWEVVKGNPGIEDDEDPTTIVTMPFEDVTIRAICEDKLYNLIVRSGSGDGDYPAKEQVAIGADVCPAGEEFDRWEVEKGEPIIEEEDRSDTILIMPPEDVIVRAVCKPILYTLIVKKGSGDGEYPGEEQVDVIADLCPPGEEFVRWVVERGSPIIDDTEDPTSVLTMPFEDVTIRAECEPILYNLIVENGDGDGDYPEGQDVPVRADPCSEEEDEFVRWEVIKGSPVIDESESRNAIVTMPGEDVTIRAICEPKLYKLTVIRGSGDGDYPAGEEVDVRGNICPPNQLFDRWDVLEGSPGIDDSNSRRTVVTMPAEDVTIEAICRDRVYELIVERGDGDGDYPEDRRVPVEADEPEEGEKFVRWDVLRGMPGIDDRNSPSTTVTMPDEDVTIRAIYEPIVYRLTVIRGSGDGDYPEGDQIRTRANPCPEGEEFERWEVVAGNPIIDDTGSPSAIVTMPGEDVTIEAICREILYRLTVERGSGDGDYPEDRQVEVEADEPPEGERFVRWEVTEGRPDIEDTTSPKTIVTMPDEDVTIVPIYEPIDYRLGVVKGTGDGDYPEGEVVDIEANSPRPGEQFERWQINKGNPVIDDVNSPSTQITIPGEDSEVEAIYTPLNRLDVIQGTGDGDYPEGEVVDIVANPPGPGEEFERWQINKGNPIIDDINSPSTEVTIPGEDSEVEAIYVPSAGTPRPRFTPRPQVPPTPDPTPRPRTTPSPRLPPTVPPTPRPRRTPIPRQTPPPFEPPEPTPRPRRTPPPQEPPVPTPPPQEPPVPTPPPQEPPVPTPPPQEPPVPTPPPQEPPVPTPPPQEPPVPTPPPQEPPVPTPPPQEPPVPTPPPQEPGEPTPSPKRPTGPTPRPTRRPRRTAPPEGTPRPRAPRRPPSGTGEPSEQPTPSPREPTRPTRRPRTPPRPSRPTPRPTLPNTNTEGD